VAGCESRHVLLGMPAGGALTCSATGNGARKRREENKGSCSVLKPKKSERIKRNRNKTASTRRQGIRPGNGAGGCPRLSQRGATATRTRQKTKRSNSSHALSLPALYHSPAPIDPHKPTYTRTRPQEVTLDGAETTQGGRSAASRGASYYGPTAASTTTTTAACWAPNNHAKMQQEKTGWRRTPG